MLFSSALFNATWDTWMYFHGGTYYLYYLITERSPGEGFGVAVSTDGIHFEDQGMQIAASDQMRHYLGTGAVWEDPHEKGQFICNYSEHRELPGGLSQQIYFAHSKDLIHWAKEGDTLCFQPDRRYYRVYETKGARWDCIYPLQKPDGGYYGVWTATPLDRMGFGLGQSQDGLHWEALPPPVIMPSPFDDLELEAGAITLHNGIYYMMIGCYRHPLGMGIFTADQITGPYKPQAKSFALFANQDKMNAYFARFLETPSGTLVNFHVLLNGENKYGRAKTYLSPLKLVTYDEQGILRLKWWIQNDQLIGKPLEAVQSICLIDLTAAPEDSVSLQCENGDCFVLRLGKNGSMAIENNKQEMVFAQRDIADNIEGNLRILLKETFLEVYWKDYYLLCYTLRSNVNQVESTRTLRFKELLLNESACGN